MCTAIPFQEWASNQRWAFVALAFLKATHLCDVVWWSWPHFPLHVPGVAVWPRIQAISLVPSDHSDGSHMCICLILGQGKLAQPFSFNHLEERTSLLLSWTWIECWPSLWGARLKLTWRKAEWQGTKSRKCMSLQSRYVWDFQIWKPKVLHLLA